MVDRKITEFTELTSVTNLDSVVAIVDIDEALPVDQNKKITVSNLLSEGSNTSYAENLGNGIDNAFSVTHNLGTMDLNVTVRENSLPFARVFPDVQFTTANMIMVDFGMTVPTTDEFRVFIDAGALGGGIGVNQFIDTVGNAVDTSIVVNHNLDFQNVVVQVYENTSPFSQVFPEVQLTDNNNVTLVFVSAPGNDEFRVIITGGVGGVVTSNVVVGGGEPYVEINSVGTLPISTGTDSIVIGPSASTGQAQAIVIGEGAGAAGTSSIAIGDGATAGNLGGTLPNGNDAIAIGNGATASANGSIQLGAGTNNGQDTLRFLGNLLADDEGLKVQVTAGTPTSLFNTGALAVDSTNDILYFRSSGTWNAAGGGGGGEDYFDTTYNGTLPNAAGTDSLSIGEGAGTTGVNAVAIGKDADGNNFAAVALGLLSQATGVNAIAIGDAATSSATDSIAIGLSASATGDDGIAIGDNTSTGTGTSGIVIGRASSIAFQNRNIAIGDAASVTGGATTDAIAIGAGATLNGPGAIAIGQMANSNGSASVSVGDNSGCSGGSSVAIGNNSGGNGTSSGAIGNGAIASANFCYQIGGGTNSAQDTIQFFSQHIANINGIEVKNAAAAPSGTPRVGTFYLDTSSGNGTLYIYSNGAWRTVAVL